MRFVYHVCCCKRLVFIACGNLQVFSILLIPLHLMAASQQHGAGRRPAIGHSARGAAVVLVKVAHERHLIGLQQIGYLYATIWFASEISGIPRGSGHHTGHAGFVATEPVCCRYGDTVAQTGPDKRATTQNLFNKGSCGPAWNAPVMIQLPLLSLTHRQVN